MAPTSVLTRMYRILSESGPYSRVLWPYSERNRRTNLALRLLLCIRRCYWEG